MFITASDRHYPQKTAIILNPHSGRLRKRLDAIRQITSTVPRMPVREPDSTGALAGALKECAASGIDHLVIAGGDGTVQAAINHLFNSGDWTTLPTLSIIPAGTTNMTAADIGATGNPHRCLEKLLQTIASQSRLQLVTRSALRIQQQDRTPVHGMFFGAGLIARGSDLFHRRIKKTGATGESLSALVILHLLTGLFSGRKEGMWSPVPLTMRDDGGQDQRGKTLMLLASTLDRLLLGMRPYWGTGEGLIHTTRIADSPRRLGSALIKILSGKGERLLSADGYYSRNNHWLELSMDAEYIIDGEFFSCAVDKGPLHISATSPLRFLLP